MAEQKKITNNTIRSKTSAISFESKFISNEKMPILVEKLQKIERDYPGEKNTRKRNIKGINQFHVIALKEGMGGYLKRYLKTGIMIGVPYYAVFTDHGSLAVTCVSTIVIGSSLVLANIRVYGQMKKEFLDIKNVIVGRNLNQTRE